MTTKGEYRVGITFDPSGDNLVAQIKRQAADLIDLIESIPDQHASEEPSFDVARCVNERRRLKALAQTEVESAAMWAVKAATKRPAEG